MDGIFYYEYGITKPHKFVKRIIKANQISTLKIMLNMLIARIVSKFSFFLKYKSNH